MNDRYTVINQEEPRGGSVAQDGIPCTARHCVTQLNRLSHDNEKLEKEVIELESRLESIKFVLKCYNSKWTKELFTEGTHTGKLVAYGKVELLNKLKEEILG
nr:hypothetical protein [Methanobrevibacter smithii]